MQNAINEETPTGEGIHVDKLKIHQFTEKNGRINETSGEECVRRTEKQRWRQPNLKQNRKLHKIQIRKTYIYIYIF